MTAVTQTEAFAKLDEGTVKDFIMKVISLISKALLIAIFVQAAQNGAFKS